MIDLILSQGLRTIGLQPDVDRHDIDLIAVRFTSTKPLPTSTKAATFILAKSVSFTCDRAVTVHGYSGFPNNYSGFLNNYKNTI